MLRDSIAKFFKVDSLIGNLTGYVETRIELIKVEAREELSKGLSVVLVYVLLAFVFGLVIVFISIAAGLKLSETLGGFWAFAIVSVFYLLVGLVLLWYRERIMQKLEKKISLQLKSKK